MKLPHVIRLQLHRLRDLHSVVPTLRQGRCRQWRWVSFPGSEQVTFESDGLRIVGDLWLPQTPARATKPVPAVVLLHGSSPQARKLAMNQTLAGAMTQRGWAVLAFDARGYGQSDAPAIQNKQQILDHTQDVADAIKWLMADGRFKAGPIPLIGHSFGAGTAIRAKLLHPSVGKVVAIGPPRRLAERFLPERAPHRQLITERLIQDMNFPTRPSDGQIYQMMAQRDVAELLPAFDQAALPEIMLVDGELEDTRDRSFLQQICKDIGHGLNYWTAPGANHYFNCGYILGRPFYEHALIQKVADQFDQFLSQPRPGHVLYKGMAAASL